MTSTDTVHLVSKADNCENVTVSLPTAAAPAELPPSSISVRPILLGLTSNNLSYARGGDLLHWWKTYPLPSTTPAPYNDPSRWGIVPAWGYALVLQSNLPDIPSNSILWGYWPTATVPTMLHLEPGDPSGHWIEVSSHRKPLMPLYNRYVQVEAQDKDRMAWTALFQGVWIGGYLLSEAVFAPDVQHQEPIHPLGAAVGLPWSAQDADLSSAVVVTLGASTKTARSFAWNLFHRPKTSGPVGFLQVTSSPAALETAAKKSDWGGATKALAYTEIDQAAEWIAGLHPSKVVIVDCGARDSVLGQLCQAIQEHPVLQESNRMILQVGSQQKVYTMDEVTAARASMQAMGKIQYNTSGIQDTLIEREGAGAYFGKVSQRWEQWLDERDSVVPDMHVVWGEGIAGENGIQGGWQRLATGSVRPEEGLIYTM
ncbi:hypothetical protein FE257_000868 [Aspergillus nanangensis]|uniref:Uncharacterized protein n=1 Tax=Aspergillus nanangensis TaxID=2582783 RepID=A0AAD4CFP6_ASPNN|nr:hypothetical protein FE257_000868 [Aspergillus nanangensis]